MAVTCCCTQQLNMILKISGGNCPVAHPLLAGLGVPICYLCDIYVALSNTLLIQRMNKYFLLHKINLNK